MKSFFTVCMLAAGLTTYAKQSGNLGAGGCGTVTTEAQVREVYDFVQHNPAAYAKGTAGTVDSIPLSIHIVGMDNGTGYYSVENLFKVICQLNDHYAGVNFYFYIKWPLHYINNTAYYTHDYWTGEDMMNNNNISGTANVYFVQDPAGNCGYYTYGADAVAIGKNCAGNNSTTLTHELGHFFSLPHTFYGWENGNTPAFPEAVRRSGPGANCNNAGDGFCDTDADFVSSRWSCPYLTTRTDINGDPYHIDSSMYMSYSLDVCQSRFSDQQIAKMQQDLHVSGNRTAIYTAAPPRDIPLSNPQIIYPVDTQYSNAPKIVWHKVPGAAYYLVRISLQSQLPKQTSLVADTSLALSFAPVDGVSYKVSVAPVSATDVCLAHTATQDYFYTARNGHVVSVPETPGNNKVSLYPTLISQGSPLYIRFADMPVTSCQINIINISGDPVYTATVNTSNRNETQQLVLPPLPGGSYFVRCTGPGFQLVKKLIVLP